MNFSLMRDATGKKIGYIGIFQDLTELKRLSEEVKQKEKLATVGEFSARIAHEIRNPLASLKSSMEMLTESGLEGPMKERLVSIALKEMDRLNGILTELLDYTRPGGAEISRFDLNESLGEIAELLKNHGATGVVFRKDFSGPLLIEGDRGRLHQVFWNLGINAIEAMESSGGGELHIGTSM
nr:PAS domain-containing sensor histidine kinase [Desulfobacterales bacterium]